MNEIEIEIDGKKLKATANQTVIQVADENGIYIPRFCYHKHLTIPANCRMCLVEVEKSGKPLPACATPVVSGMKVYTQSSKTIAAQRSVMEYLLINHPLDCPICDQGGECELQDLSMGYGSSRSQYTETKRSIADKDLGPLIASEMTRCIACTRCVRFGDEIAGLRELGLTFRGENVEISTYVQHAIRSEVSGNIIDLCPVGALTSKPFRFRARAWELSQGQSVAPHDCIGSNIRVHTRYGKVMRVVANEQPEINETWIADRDRFSYEGLYHPDRLEEPRVKINGKWQVVDWQKALEITAISLQEAISEYGSDQLGALASPNSTLEEFFLLQKIIRGLGSPHIDHRLREIDTKDQESMPLCPALGMSLNELEGRDSILLMGSNLQKEQPIAALRLRKASRKNTSILVINPVDYRFNFFIQRKKIVAPHLMAQTLLTLVRALDETALPEWGDVSVDDESKAFAFHLKEKQKPCILIGALAMHDRDASSIRFLAKKLAELIGAKLGIMTDGANSAGGWLSGCIPHRYAGGATANPVGLNAYQMLKNPRKAYVLMNVEPDVDCANPVLADEALKQAKCVIALSLFKNPVLEKYAHVILPMAAFTETEGTFINTALEWQSFKHVVIPYGSARPGWKILRKLGNFLHLDGFSYNASEAISEEIKNLFENNNYMPQNFTVKPERKELQSKQLSRIGEIPIYCVDSLVRRSTPLQDTQVIMEGEMAVIRLHPQTAEKLNLQEGEEIYVKQEQHRVKLPLMFDARVALDATLIMGGIDVTKNLGDLFGAIGIEK